MRRLHRLSIAAALLALVMLAPAALAASAALSLTTPSSVAVGADIPVHIALTDGAGRALADEPVELRADGDPIRRARTDAAGTVALAVTTSATGRRALSVLFGGDGEYGAARATATVDVRTAVVTIQTVPAVPGIVFTLGGTHFTSGADGVATIFVATSGEYTLSADVPDDMQVDDDTRVSFVRWDGSEFYSTRQITVGGDTGLQVGLSLSHPVQFHVVDLQGADVPSSRVTSLTVQASTGTRFTFDDMGPHWLMANRVQRLRNGMIATPVQYAVASVMLGGSNVVNRFQQRYEVQGGDVWEVSLLLYDAALRGRDALFGTAVGDGVILSYPDGRTVEHPFGPDGVARFESLARGTYHVRVAGAAGFAPVAPLALSRNQDTSIKVLSVLDMAVLGGAVLGLAIGLMVLGRGVPWLRRRRERRALAAYALHVGVAGMDANGMDVNGATVREASGAAAGGTATEVAADAQHAHGEGAKATAHGWHRRGDGRDDRRFAGLLGKEGR